MFMMGRVVALQQGRARPEGGVGTGCGGAAVSKCPRGEAHRGGGREDGLDGAEQEPRANRRVD